MAKTKSDVDDQTQYGKRITALEENVGAVDEARVKLEERVEHLESFEDMTQRVVKLEALVEQLMKQGHDARQPFVPTDSMGLPKVV